MIERACISLNHRCNLQCRYCHFAGKETEIGSAEYEFSAEEAGRIVTNIEKYCRGHGIERFKFGIVGSGEPLLSFKVLMHIVEKAKECGALFHLYTITNGVNVTDRYIQYFYRNKDVIDLGFSLDGDEEIHNTLRQGYQRTAAAIKLYEKWFGEKPCINATVTKKSIKEADRLVNFFVNSNIKKVNFSIVCGIEDPDIYITQEEYSAFIDKCADAGIVMRQRRNDIGHVYDCAKFGRRCGVGHSNIFYTRKGIYPCGRFFGLDEFKLAEFETELDEVEKTFINLKNSDSESCFYDKYAGGRK